MSLSGIKGCVDHVFFFLMTVSFNVDVAYLLLLWANERGRFSRCAQFVRGLKWADTNVTLDFLSLDFHFLSKRDVRG